MKFGLLTVALAICTALSLAVPDPVPVIEELGLALGTIASASKTIKQLKQKKLIKE